MNGYIISALVERGVNLADARQLVERRMIKIPINVDILSDKDIASLVALLKDQQEDEAVEITDKTR